MEGTMANITLFAADFAPKSWMMCNGSILPISTNQALFSLLGTMYGGNGTTTFALPDLRGRIPVGTGAGPGLQTYVLGEVSGTQANTMLSANMPAHTHGATVTIQAAVNNTAAATDGPDGGFYGQAGYNLYNTSPGTNQYFGALNLTENLQPAGSSLPIPNMMPYTALNYIICTMGIYPSRS